MLLLFDMVKCSKSLFSKTLGLELYVKFKCDMSKTELPFRGVATGGDFEGNGGKSSKNIEILTSQKLVGSNNKLHQRDAFISKNIENIPVLFV